MATSSSVGSDIFAIAALLTIALLVLLLIRHYLPLRVTPAYLLVPVFLALVLPCSIIVLVPIDLASTDDRESEHSRGIWLPPAVVLVTWRITYWLIFVLTWFILPFLGEYCDSGYRDAKSRALYSLRNNARYQLVVLTVGIAGLVYFIWENGFHAASIKGLVIALAYTYGLILAVGLMGHGLVALPRRLYKNARVGERLQRLQSQAPAVKDKLSEASEELEKLEQTVMQLKRHKGGASRDQQEWIDELADGSGLLGALSGAAPQSRNANPDIPGVVTDRYLADLSRKLRRARHKKARFTHDWMQLCDQARDAQAVLDSSSTRKLSFQGTNSGAWSYLTPMKYVTPTMRFYLHMYVIPFSRIGLAVVLALASIAVVWSEVINVIAPKLSIIGLTIVHFPNSAAGGKVGFAGQLIAGAWLLYMDASTLYAISDVKVWGNRALVRRQTYGESACWYALQVTKLTVPLSYNFITLLPAAVYKDTNFFQFLGKLIDLTPLGAGFSAFFPLILLVPVLASAFNLYGKAKNVFGFGVLEDDSDDNPSGFGTGGWREGRALITQELQSRDSGDALDNFGSRGASLDLEQGSRTLAASVPSPTRAPRVTPRSSAAPAAPSAGIQGANRQFRAITGQPAPEEDEDDSPRHFYQDFGERVRNTFDSMERPGFIKNFSFKTPKWMQKDGNNPEDSNGDPSGLNRWFGGRPDDGRVRL